MNLVRKQIIFQLSSKRGVKKLLFKGLKGNLNSKAVGALACPPHLEYIKTSSLLVLAGRNQNIAIF